MISHVCVCGMEQLKEKQQKLYAAKQQRINLQEAKIKKALKQGNHVSQLRHVSETVHCCHTKQR